MADSPLGVTCGREMCRNKSVKHEVSVTVIVKYIITRWLPCNSFYLPLSDEVQLVKKTESLGYCAEFITHVRKQSLWLD